MKFRKHGATIYDSMAELWEVNTLKDIAGIYEPHIQLKEEDITMQYYGFDPRINWDTYIVLHKSLGVLGFMDGQIKAVDNKPSKKNNMFKDIGRATGEVIDELICDLTGNQNIDESTIASEYRIRKESDNA